jgi:hypothetical protein
MATGLSSPAAEGSVKCESGYYLGNDLKSLFLELAGVIGCQFHNVWIRWWANVVRTKVSNESSGSESYDGSNDAWS